MFIIPIIINQVPFLAHRVQVDIVELLLGEGIGEAGFDVERRLEHLMEFAPFSVTCIHAFGKQGQRFRIHLLL